MASLLTRVLGVFRRTATDVATDVLNKQMHKHGLRGSTETSQSSRKPETSQETGRRGPSPAARPQRSTASASSDHHPAKGSSSHRGVTVYDVASRGLPRFDYVPDPDGQADPGEVVWTWVPYEEDATKGKDRPVLVLARSGHQLVVAQMTSKDHDLDAEQEARWGRYWFDVGSGPWDSKGRPSEVRLDRLLSVDPGSVRREGATMPRQTFEAVLEALQTHWG